MNPLGAVLLDGCKVPELEAEILKLRKELEWKQRLIEHLNREITDLSDERTRYRESRGRIIEATGACTSICVNCGWSDFQGGFARCSKCMCWLCDRCHNGPCACAEDSDGESDEAEGSGR